MMTRLTRLEFPRNRFSGTIPSELGELGVLELLVLEGVRFSGVVPSEFGRLRHLSLGLD